MTERWDGHACWSCGKLFALAYPVHEGERLKAAPVNCPECGRLNHLPVARDAAVVRNYRAERIRARVSEASH